MLRVIRDDTALMRLSRQVDALAEAGLDLHEGIIILPEDTAELTFSRDALTVSLVHEVIHACLAAVPPAELTEEAVVEALALALVPVLRQNPALVEFITTPPEPVYLYPAYDIPYITPTWEITDHTPIHTCEN